MKTYVFDFYNLYIPKGEKYENKELGIVIKPLRIADDFEKNRTKSSSIYRNKHWITAKCFVRSKNKDEAKKYANWLGMIYSFAQNRSVFYLKIYEYKSGKKYFSSDSKFIESINSGSFRLIEGIKVKGNGYTENISEVINCSMDTLSKCNDKDKNKILQAIHAYLISKTPMVYELKFLIIWIVLEKLANEHYLKNSNRVFTKEEVKKIKEAIDNTLNEQLKKDKRLNSLKRNFSSNYLYEYNTFSKVVSYLSLLDLGFEKKKLEKMIETLVEIRIKLVHNLNSTKLQHKPYYLFYLQKIIERVILRNLGVDKKFEEMLLMNQYNIGTEI